MLIPRQGPKNLSFTQKVVDKSQAVGLLLDVDGTFLRCFSVGSPRNRELEMAKNLHFFNNKLVLQKAKPISQNSLQCSPAPKASEIALIA